MVKSFKGCRYLTYSKEKIAIFIIALKVITKISTLTALCLFLSWIPKNTLYVCSFVSSFEKLFHVSVKFTLLPPN